LTGHFVYSTLHTNDSKSAAIRLLDMGAEAFIVATVLRAVIAQRLLRRICLNCITSYELSIQEKVWFTMLMGEDHNKKIFKKGAGCTYCHKTGYYGQIGVFELFEITPELADALRLNHTTKFMKLADKNKNFVPLMQQCLNLVLQDITTISEVIRNMGQISETAIIDQPVAES
jgi:MSHA biogenesis protein MshE